MGAPDKKKIAEMVVLNDLGKSARQIGAQTGHSPTTVAKYLRWIRPKPEHKTLGSERVLFLLFSRGLLRL